MHFLLAPSCRGVVRVSVNLLWELMCMGLIFKDNQWAWSPLVAWVVRVTGGGQLSVIRGMPRMIPGIVHECSSLHLFGSINNRVPGIDSLVLSFHNHLLSKSGSSPPCLCLPDCFSFLARELLVVMIVGSIVGVRVLDTVAGRCHLTG
jgi:hypothetical protein